MMGARVALLGMLVVVAGACTRPATLTRLVEAQSLASSLHVVFTRSVEASNRAVMAADEATAADAANESREAAATADRQIRELQQVLESLTYQIELKRLDGFRASFDEYRQLNDNVLSLVLENTNAKAQRLSFGPAADAAEAFHQSVQAAAAPAGTPQRCAADALAATAWAAVLEIRALYPRHIAEADEAEMTRLEATMNGAAARARAALEQLKQQVPEAAGRLGEARQSLDRFMAIHAEILDLSRRNSNVRALALALGHRRTAAAAAEANLTAVEEALRSHEFAATR